MADGLGACSPRWFLRQSHRRCTVQGAANLESGCKQWDDMQPSFQLPKPFALASGVPTATASGPGWARVGALQLPHRPPPS